jgi:hypothetical protein
LHWSGRWLQQLVVKFGIDLRLTDRQLIEHA